MANFALNYNRANPYMNQVQEIIINFHPSNSLLDFLQEHSSQRIVISIEDGEGFIKSKGIEYFELFHQAEVKNFVLRFPSLFDERTITEKDIQALRSAGLPFFFNDYIDKWDAFYGYIKLGVSDIYITNELGFELDKIHKIAVEQNVKIRTFPNVAQSSWYTTPDLIKFFIRPEDIVDYEPYVDIFELKEDDPSRPEIGTVLYRAYAIDHQWYGQLNEIIANFSDPLNGIYTHPLWSERRIKCGKKCLKGGSCNMCYTIAGLADTLEKAGITVTRKEDKPLRTKEELEQLINTYYGDEIPTKEVNDILSDAVEDIDNL